MTSLHEQHRANGALRDSLRMTDGSIRSNRPQTEAEGRAQFQCLKARWRREGKGMVWTDPTVIEEVASC